MTNKEIAKQLNISPAALSLIINHKPGISDATRARVLAQLEEMGCSHLIKTSAPAVPKSNICFIIYKRHGEILDQHPFFMLLMENIEVKAQEMGYGVLLSTIDRRKPLEPQVRHLRQLQADGCIVFATEMYAEDLDFFSNLHIPCVFLDNCLSTSNVNTVSINNEMGAWQAIEYLVGLGHTRIGYLRSSVRISSFDERETAFRNALEQFRLSLPADMIFSVRQSEEGSYQDFKQVLEGNPLLPTAFVADDDTIAVGVMEALTRHGYRIPDDISLIGFNDRPVCMTTKPALSTINVSRYTFAYAAVGELVRMIKELKSSTGELRSRKIRMGTKLIVRDSTAGPAS